MTWAKWLLFTTAITLTTQVAQAAPDVVTSIKPVHSLVSAVMGDLGHPSLIVDGQASPHHFSLKPSQAQALADADVVFWIGDTLETFLAKPIETIAQNAISISLINTSELILLPLSEDGHNHGHDHDEDHSKTAGADPHIWLDPQNAQHMITAIAKTLGDADPKNAQNYQANAQQAQNSISQLTNQLDEAIKPLRDINYVVFHNAYNYFENRFGLANSGIITLNPEIAPSAKRIAEIRDALQSQNVACIFAEPQFDQAIIKAVVKDTQTQTGLLDPLGANLESGPELYNELLQSIVQSFRGCLK